MRIGVLTSGGDAPGMNAAVRSVTKAGIARGHVVIGIRRGYEGLLDGDKLRLSLTDVDGISRSGGTQLGSARSKRFATPEGQQLARDQVTDLGLDALVVIGGNGSLAGAHALAEGRPCQVVGLPASIDNDVAYSRLSIGVDTAVNTIVEACDRISDTARAHRRAFIVEVMGRHCGYLAMRAGIAADADAIVFADLGQPEEEALVERLSTLLSRSFHPARDKKRVLIVKAEGVAVSTSRLVRRLQEHLDAEVPGVGIRETILGHVVRGGSPSAFDRLIAQRLGAGSVLGLEQGLHDVMFGWDGEPGVGSETPDPSVRAVPLTQVLAETKRMLSGVAESTRRRVQLLQHAEALLAL